MIDIDKRRRAGFSAVVDTNLRGKRGLRWMIGLRSPGCTYAWENPEGGCYTCGVRFASTRTDTVTSEDYLAQIEHALSDLSPQRENLPILEVDVFNGGNYLNPREIDDETQIAILSRISEFLAPERIMIESSPIYVTDLQPRRLKEAVGDTELVVSIGLETYSDFIRRRCMNKPFNREGFERACRLLAENDVGIMAYVAIKPPFITEREAIEEAIATSDYLANLKGEEDMNLSLRFQPFFVHSNATLLGRLYDHGLYEPPWLWSVRDVVLNSLSFGPFDVGTTDEDPAPYAVPENRIRGSRHPCSSEFQQAFTDFNKTGNPGGLKNLECSCRDEWINCLSQDPPPLLDRIERYSAMVGWTAIPPNDF